MLDEQAPTLAMPEEIDRVACADNLIDRFTNPSPETPDPADCDGRQPEAPQRLLDPAGCGIIADGSDYRHLVLGVAGWMRYVSGTDEQGNKIDIA